MGLELPVWDLPTIAWWIAALGLVGASVLDRFLDDGDDGSSTEMDDDDLFGGTDGGAAGGGGGGGSGGGEFGEFDGMDEWDDEFDDDSGANTNTDELENRIDELEAEVAELSSTVSTVRSENTEISETVEGVEEDVRNLLDIYEMVTRGINPFVDESSGFDAAGEDAALGLFDDGESETQEEDLDESIADADASGFFDEDLVDPDAETDAAGDIEEEPFDDTTDQTTAETDTDTEDDMTDDGKSFSELKEEYESGEADWANDASEEVPGDDDAFDDTMDETAMDETAMDETAMDETAFDDSLEESIDELETEPETVSDDPPDSEYGGDPAESGGFEYVGSDDLASGGSRGKPYLKELPGDYVGDLLVMEWLEFLVDAASVTDAVRAINYYEQIEWIGPGAAEGLRSFLSGFGRVDRNRIDQPGTEQLTREHHTRSLRYITQLNGTTAHTVLLDRWEQLAGGSMVGGTPPAPATDGRAASTRSPTEGERSRRSNGHDDRSRRSERNGHTTSSRPMTDPAAGSRSGSESRERSDGTRPDEREGWSDGR